MNIGPSETTDGKTNRRIVLAQRPSGNVTSACFANEQLPMPESKPDQLLVKVSWISIDPAIRAWMATDTYLPAIEVGEVIRSAGLGTVVSSNNDQYPVGSTVLGMVGWQEYTTLGSEARLVPGGVSPEAALSVFGVTGLTAYFGMLEVGKPVAGETVLVSGAAGSTGSIAGQIAQIKGCTVIGIAGTDEKCRRLLDEYGFDGAINYRTDDVPAAITRHCPNGVDVFFDNVGGSILEAGIGNLKMNGRVVLCGSISTYNDESPRPGPNNLANLISMRARMEGFIVLDYLDQSSRAVADLSSWVVNGQLTYNVDIVDGLTNAPKALDRLFTGSNTGKTLVRL